MTAAIERALLPFFAFAAIRIVTFPHAKVDLRVDAAAHRPMLEAIESGDVRAARAAFAQAMHLWLAETRAHIVATQEARP